MDSKNVWKGLAFGGISSCVAEVITLPMDTVKTRLQLQGELGSTRNFNGSFDAARKTVASEGVTALWKGLTPALVRQASYGAMRYGLYSPIKKFLGVREDSKEKVSFGIRVSSGAIAGGLAAVVCNPTDLVKVRMQADGVGKPRGYQPRYKGLFHAFSTIAKEEGVAGLWKGAGPTTGRAAVLAASELSTYDEVKTQLLRRQLMQEGTPLHFTTALVAGFVSAWCSSPFDVVKSRVMSQPFDANGKGLRYTGMLDCFVKSTKAEGPFALWKGFWPNFARIGPRVVIVFVVMEQLRKHFD